MGDYGLITTSLPINTVVADRIRDVMWWISKSRSRNPLIQLLIQCLPSQGLVSPDGGDDTYLWKISNAPPSSSFSTSQTWHQLNPPNISVDWHEVILFIGRIHKHAFIAWIATRQQLDTRDRLLTMGSPCTFFMSSLTMFMMNLLNISSLTALCPTRFGFLYFKSPCSSSHPLCAWI